MQGVHFNEKGSVVSFENGPEKVTANEVVYIVHTLVFVYMNMQNILFKKECYQNFVYIIHPV